MFTTTGEPQLKIGRRLSRSTEYGTCIATSTAIINAEVIICLVDENDDSDHCRVLFCIMGVMESNLH